MTMPDRYLDLLKQGFMKPRRSRPTPKELPIVSCNACMNWHKKGKHTADEETRKANLEIMALSNLKKPEKGKYETCPDCECNFKLAPGNPFPSHREFGGTGLCGMSGKTP